MLMIGIAKELACTLRRCAYLLAVKEETFLLLDKGYEALISAAQHVIVMKRALKLVVLRDKAARNSKLHRIDEELKLLIVCIVKVLRCKTGSLCIERANDLKDFFCSLRIKAMHTKTFAQLIIQITVIRKLDQSLANRRSRHAHRIADHLLAHTITCR